TELPQRLKARFVNDADDTAEAVPFQNPGGQQSQPTTRRFFGRNIRHRGTEGTEKKKLKGISLCPLCLCGEFSQPQLALAVGLVGCVLLTACAVGPNYHRPPVQAPSAYKTEAPWRTAAPKDSLPKGTWWEIYSDPELNAYEHELLQTNQSLVAAKDRLSE